MKNTRKNILKSNSTFRQAAPEKVLPLAGDYSAYPLRMLTDLPRTAHIFRSIANRPLPPDMVQDDMIDEPTARRGSAGAAAATTH